MNMFFLFWNADGKKASHAIYVGKIRGVSAKAWLKNFFHPDPVIPENFLEEKGVDVAEAN